MTLRSQYAPALPKQVLHLFQKHYRTGYTKMVAYNWGTAPYEHQGMWDIEGTCTYINGIMLTIDNDYEMGWLLELCDQHEAETLVWHMAVGRLVTSDEDGYATSLWTWNVHDHPRFPFFDLVNRPSSLDIHTWFIHWWEEVNDANRRA